MEVGPRGLEGLNMCTGGATAHRQDPRL